VFVAKRFGETSGGGERAAGLLDLTRGAVECRRDQQGTGPQAVVVEPRRDGQRLVGVLPAVPEAVRPDADEAERGQQPPAQHVRRAGRHQRDRVFQVVQSCAVDTVAQLATQPQQPCHPERVGPRVEVVQCGRAVADPDGGLAGR